MLRRGMNVPLFPIAFGVERPRIVGELANVAVTATTGHPTREINPIATPTCRARSMRPIRGSAQPQCEIIQGRFPGKLLAPFLPRLVRRMDLPVQQEQPAPWLAFICDSSCGAWALRSLVACASRRSAGMAAK